MIDGCVITSSSALCTLHRSSLRGGSLSLKFLWLRFWIPVRHRYFKYMNTIEIEAMCTRRLSISKFGLQRLWDLKGKFFWVVDGYLEKREKRREKERRFIVLPSSTGIRARRLSRIFKGIRQKAKNRQDSKFKMKNDAREITGYYRAPFVSFTSGSLNGRKRFGRGR